MKEQINYADLDINALLDILAKLEDLVDVVRCSAVCKSWQAACQRVHPTSIYITPDLYYEAVVFNPEGLNGVLKWLQLKNRAGCFNNLHRLAVSVNEGYCTFDCSQDQCLQFFSQSIVALAGSWHLLRFSMSLHSPLDMAVPMLPPSLRHLVLEVHTAILPESVSLSMFEGLRELQKLELKLCSHEEQSVIDQRQRTAHFGVDAHLSTVTSLVLSPWAIDMPAGKTLSDDMPSLQHLDVYATPGQAQVLLDLASLHTLTLNIISFGAMHEHHWLKVCASSHLHFLKLFCSSPNSITLLMNNANVEYYTSGVHSVATTYLVRVAPDFFDDMTD